MSRPRKTAVTRTRQATRREVQKALRKAGLTREEEIVLRMRYGIPEPKSAHLEFRGESDPEVAAKLAIIEADALATMRPRATEADLEGGELKRAIIARLKKI